MSVSHTRPDWPALLPYLTLDNPDDAIAFLEQALDAEVLEDEREDGLLRHALIRVEGCLFEMSQAREPWTAMPAAIHLYVPDIEASHARCVAAGGTSMMEPADMPYGERNSAILDPAGNRWYLAQHTGVYADGFTEEA